MYIEKPKIPEIQSPGRKNLWGIEFLNDDYKELLSKARFKEILFMEFI